MGGSRHAEGHQIQELTVFESNLGWLGYCFLCIWLVAGVVIIAVALLWQFPLQNPRFTDSGAHTQLPSFLLLHRRPRQPRQRHFPAALSPPC